MELSAMQEKEGSKTAMLTRRTVERIVWNAVFTYPDFGQNPLLLQRFCDGLQNIHRGPGQLQLATFR